MTKKLSIPMVVASIMALSLNSCRSEDLLNSNEELPPSKFRVFTAQEKETINYAKGFKTLLERYDEINNVQHTAKALRKAFKNSSEMADEYAELNIRSQDFTTKTNEKFTLFPLIKNRKVDGIIIAVLKENDTQVEFLKMYTEVENYSKMLEMFKEAYLKNTLQQRIASKANGDCSSDGSPCDTGEVVITMPGTGGTILGGVWNGGPPPGGCQPYDNCLNPEGGNGPGGGDGPGTDTAPKNPCEQMRAQKTDPTYKEKTAFLKTKTGESFETGFRVGKPVPGSGQTGIQYQALSNAPGSNTVNFPIFSTTYGMMHTHTSALVPVFSPDDINTFIKLLVNASTNNIPLSDVFLSVVNPDGTVYQLRGEGIDPVGLSIFDQDYINNVLNDIYIGKDYDLGKPNQTAAYYQTQFLKFMKDKMNVTGAKFYSVDAQGKATERYLQGEELKETDCPIIELP